MELIEAIAELITIGEGMVGVVGGAASASASAECADSMVRPESSQSLNELQFSPAVVVTARRVYRGPQNLYDAMQLGGKSLTLYLSRFEKDVQSFIGAALLSPKGMLLPDALYITCPELEKVNEISARYHTASQTFGRLLGGQNVSSEAKILIKSIGYILEAIIFLNDDEAWFGAVKAPGVLSLKPDVVGDLINYDAWCPALIEESKCRVIFRRFFSLIKILRDKDVSKDSPELLIALEHMADVVGANPDMFDDVDETVDDINQFLSGDMDLASGIDTDQEMFEYFSNELIKDLFPDTDFSNQDFLTAFQAYFEIYDKNIDYLRALCALKKGYVDKYLASFTHKIIQSLVEKRLANDEGIVFSEYELYEVRGISMVDRICNPNIIAPQVVPLMKLRDVLHEYVVKSLRYDLTVVALPDLELSKYALLIEDMLVDVRPDKITEKLEMEELSILSPEDAIKVVRQMSFDPRCDLLKASYLRMFETLAEMKARVAVLPPVVEVLEHVI